VSGQSSHFRNAHSSSPAGITSVFPSSPGTKSWKSFPLPLNVPFQCASSPELPAAFTQRIPFARASAISASGIPAVSTPSPRL
jgi:hypothetical protein